jgi:DNA sulfur modification protein DndC
MHIRNNGPEEVRSIDLITLPELAEIRRHWVLEKHELEDRLPVIYEEVTGESYPGGRLDDNLVLGAQELAVLREICGDDDLHYQLTRELLDVERRHRTMIRRSGLFKAMEQALRRGFYENADEAESRALERREMLNGVRAAVSEPERLLQQLVELPVLEPEPTS